MQNNKLIATLLGVIMALIVFRAFPLNSKAQVTSTSETILEPMNTITPNPAMTPTAFPTTTPTLTIQVPPPTPMAVFGVENIISPRLTVDDFYYMVLDNVVVTKEGTYSSHSEVLAIDLAEDLTTGISYGTETLWGSTAVRCGISLIDTVNLAKKVALNRGIPWSYFGTTQLTESRFVMFAKRPDTACGIMRNSAGAYGTGQIYRPGGYYEEDQVHPEYTVDWNSTACQASEGTPEYLKCLWHPLSQLQASADILLDYYNGCDGDWNCASIRYKGYPTGYNDYFYNVFQPALQKGGFYDTFTGNHINLRDEAVNQETPPGGDTPQ